MTVETIYSNDTNLIIGVRLIIGEVVITSIRGRIDVAGIKFPVPLDREGYLNTNQDFWTAHPEAADLLSKDHNLNSVCYRLTPTITYGDETLAIELGERFQSYPDGREYVSKLTGTTFDDAGVYVVSARKASTTLTWEQWENLLTRHRNERWAKTLRRNR